MTLHFQIDYQTVYGQEIVLNIIDSQTKNGDKKVSQYRMSTTDGKTWEANIRREQAPGSSIEYFYTVARGENTERCEWREICHKLEFSAKNATSYHI